MMEAGRKLDAAIETQIMGCTVTVTEPDALGKQLYLTNYLGPKGREVRSYSSDEKVAIRVIVRAVLRDHKDRFESYGLKARFSGEYDPESWDDSARRYTPLWSARFGLHQDHTWAYEAASTDSLAHAICLAALEAKERTENEPL